MTTEADRDRLLRACADVLRGYTVLPVRLREYAGVTYLDQTTAETRLSATINALLGELESHGY